MGRDEKINPFARVNVPIIGQQPPSEIKDLLGRTLAVGDFVMLPNRHPQFEVAKIEPVPSQQMNQPTGMVLITLRCMMALQAMTGGPIEDIVRTMKKEERSESIVSVVPKGPEGEPS